MHGEARGTPYAWNSYAVDCRAAGVLALIDPLRMTDEEASELEAMRRPTHILLTCEYHVREALVFRNKWGCRILANRLEAHWYEIDLDEYFEDSQLLWDRIEPVYVPGVTFQETAFLVRGDGGTLIVGDLVAGGRRDLGIQDEDLALIGPQFVGDLRRARAALRKLLDLDFQVLCFAHGTPVREDPKRKLEAYLSDDSVWEELQTRKDTAVLTDEDRAHIALIDRLRREGTPRGSACRDGSR